MIIKYTGRFNNKYTIDELLKLFPERVKKYR